jgi:hypothetical protein
MRFGYYCSRSQRRIPTWGKILYRGPDNIPGQHYRFAGLALSVSTENAVIEDAPVIEITSRVRRLMNGVEITNVTVLGVCRG